MFKDAVFEDGLVISSEKAEDYADIRNIITVAFGEEKEDTLVDETRLTETFKADYSLVAKFGNRAVGHLLLNPVKIISPVKETDAVIIAPLTVLPEYQGKKVGSRLIEVAVSRARADKMPFVLVMGGNYYEKFGFNILAHEVGIFRPHPIINKQTVRIKELEKNGLKGVMGVIKYPESFKNLVEKW